MLGKHFVLGRHDLADRGEVAGTAPGCRGESQLAPHQPEQDTEQRSGDQKPELALLAEQGERDADEQPDAQSGDRARQGRPAAGQILTSLRVLLGAARTDHADAIIGPSIELILYAGKRGALTDLAADLSWLTGRDLSDFVLDAHLIVPDNSGDLRRMSWINQAIGVLIGRGDTPEHAAREVGMLATRTNEDRRVSAEHLRIGLGDPNTQSI